MTYCLGIRLNSGIVFASDSCTNAGVDNISTFRKLFVYEIPGERVICVMTAGNLAVTQSVVSQLEEGLDGEENSETLYTVTSLSDAAQLVGRAIRKVKDRDESTSKQKMEVHLRPLSLVGRSKGGGCAFIRSIRQGITLRRLKTHPTCKSVNPSMANRSWNVWLRRYGVTSGCKMRNCFHR